MYKHKKIILVFLIIVSTVVMLIACGQKPNDNYQGEKGEKAPDSDKRKFYSIGTGTMSGTYYSLGNSLASLYNEEIYENINFSAESTAGSGQNVAFLGQGEVQLAFVNNDVAKAAYNGIGAYEGNKIDSLRGITSVYGNSIHIITGKDSGINTVSDLKGKKVSVGAAGSGVESITRMIVEIYGMDYWGKKDFTPEYLGVTESMEKLKNGQLDAVFMTGLPPMGAVVDVFMGGKVKLIPLESDKIAELIKKYPELYEITIPAGSYNTQDKDVLTVANAALLLTSIDIDEETVYQMTKILFEHLNYLTEKNKVWSEVKSEDFQKGMTVPIHPGAKRYFKNKGILK